MANLIVTRSNEIALVDFATRDVLDVATAKEVGDELREIIDRGEVTKLLVDFRTIRLISSSMIGELLALLALCKEAKADLKLCSMSKDLAGLFKKLKLDKSFQIYSNREQAIHAFKANR